jgi:WhiB family transcriptional regulator, redox-sensing transcriptional regulator
MRPQFHKILEETKLIGKHGKSVTRYVLRYNPKLFIQGACKGIDTEVFYPIKDTFTREEENMIERMCIDCPIMMACLEWGIAHETYGVWGGTTPNKRKIIRNNLGWVASEPKI